MAGEAPRVDPCDAGDAVADQVGVQVGLRTPAAVATGEVADDHTRAPRAQRFVVVVVDAVVADVGIGEGDDLPA